MTAAPGAASEVVLALSTAPDAEQAARMGRALVEERLIACMNLLPGLTSIYRWQGAVQQEAEVLLLMKTTRSRVAELKARLPELHPYDVPELVVVEVTDGLAPYCGWVRAETAG